VRAFSGGSRSKDDKGPSLGMIMLVVGIVLFVVGYVGIFRTSDSVSNFTSA
jgi:flagellar basal body-associated protein FliL